MTTNMTQSSIIAKARERMQEKWSTGELSWNGSVKNGFSLERFKTLLEQELTLAISTTQEQALAEYRGKIEKELPDLSQYEGKELRFWQGYRKGIEKSLSLFTDNKIEE